MIKKDDFTARIMEIDIFDTHSHLTGDRLGARDFWEIGEYFWFLEELFASGYPGSFFDFFKPPEERKIIPEKEKTEAYLKAFNATRNTCMNGVVRRIFSDLYNIEIKDEKSILEANEAVKASSADKGWALQVAGKLSIKKIAVNEEKDINFVNLPDTCVFIPRIDYEFNEWVYRIVKSQNPSKTADAVLEEMDDLLIKYKNMGCRGIMIDLPDFGLKASDYDTSFKLSQNSRDEIIIYLFHWVCELAEKYGFFVQLFLGVHRMGWSRRATSVNDPYRILKLHGAFDKYNCNFEIVTAADINVMDAVQEARTFSNVNLGGLWWFSFRYSIFMEAMQKRFEALPPSACSFIISDARCIEWCYGKSLLIKRILADFLYKKVEDGWIGLDEAWWVAEEWLYKSAVKRYGVI